MPEISVYCDIKHTSYSPSCHKQVASISFVVHKWGIFNEGFITPYTLFLEILIMVSSIRVWKLLESDNLEFHTFIAIKIADNRQTSTDIAGI